MTLNVGDIVRLNSGSPPLTIIAIEGEMITVVWVGNGPMLSTTLPAVCVHMDPEKKRPMEAA